MNAGAFAYAQARLHARHGSRPSVQLWLQLMSSGNLANFIQQAQQSALRPWVAGLQATRSTHDIELALRGRFHDYVNDVAGWLPGGWDEAVRRVGRLPALPAVQHLARGGAVLPWMLEDPELRVFARESGAARKEALQQSDWGFLLRAEEGVSVHDAWLAYWRHCWPVPGRFTAGLENLGRWLQRYAHSELSGQAMTAEQRRELLEKGLGNLFRRYSFEPAAACAHVGLVALDLEQLRGELLQRALFAETPAGRA